MDFSTPSPKEEIQKTLLIKLWGNRKEKLAINPWEIKLEGRKVFHMPNKIILETTFEFVEENEWNLTTTSARHSQKCYLHNFIIGQF